MPSATARHVVLPTFWKVSTVSPSVSVSHATAPSFSKSHDFNRPLIRVAAGSHWLDAMTIVPYFEMHSSSTSIPVAVGVVVTEVVVVGVVEVVAVVDVVGVVVVVAVVDVVRVVVVVGDVVRVVVVVSVTVGDVDGVVVNVVVDVAVVLVVGVEVAWCWSLGLSMW